MHRCSLLVLYIRVLIVVAVLCMSSQFRRASSNLVCGIMRLRRREILLPLLPCVILCAVSLRLMVLVRRLTFQSGGGKSDVSQQFSDSGVPSAFDAEDAMAWLTQHFSLELTPEALEGAVAYLVDTVRDSLAKGKKVMRLVTIHADELFRTCSSELKRAVDKLRQDFQAGSEDRNYAIFAGQFVRWMYGGTAKSRFELDQNLKIKELSEMSYDRAEGLDSTRGQEEHHQYRRALGQINSLQSRTQFQSCYGFSRCASNAAAPVIADAKRWSKLIRTIRTGY